MPDFAYDRAIESALSPQELEERLLAPYAMRSRDTRGREYPQPEHSYRTAFQRDRDRIIHSAAFRRLMNKTQVFAYKESDYYRTRLTHTMEVAQISRTASRILGLNEDLAEAIALAHDLGHPPFGHVGEDVLRELMGEFGGFEHNWQGLRIVEMLEVRYPEFPGLNLTWETREGIMKYRPTNRTLANSEFVEAGRPTLEAQLVNVADEIAYSCHDADDGLKASILTEEQIAAETAIGAKMAESMDGQGGGLNRSMRRYRLVRQLVNYFVTDLADSSRKRIAESGVASIADVRAADGKLAGLSANVAKELADLKKFLFKSFYQHPRIAGIAEDAKKYLSCLYKAYLDDLNRLPEGARARIETEGKERVVCDYIAGMTDWYALDEYRRIA